MVISLVVGSTVGYEEVKRTLNRRASSHLTISFHVFNGVIQVVH
jgi:hypothetical protein